MHYVHFVQILNATDNLLENFAGFFLRNPKLFKAYFLFLTIWSKSSPPSIYSIMRNNCLGVYIISYSWIILGWRMSLRMWIYRATLYTSATSMILSFYSILTATFWPVRVCIADLTFPKVPFPIVLLII